MRLIDADALLREAHEEGAYGYVDAEQIANAPTIDPVKHGKWLRTPTWWAYCSVCGMEPPNESNETTDYCPNCGTKMDMDEDPSHPFADSVMMGERSEE